MRISGHRLAPGKGPPALRSHVTSEAATRRCKVFFNTYRGQSQGVFGGGLFHCKPLRHMQHLAHKKTPAAFIRLARIHLAVRGRGSGARLGRPAWPVGVALLDDSSSAGASRAYVNVRGGKAKPHLVSSVTAINVARARRLGRLVRFSCKTRTPALPELRGVRGLPPLDVHLRVANRAGLFARNDADLASVSLPLDEYARHLCPFCRGVHTEHMPRSNLPRLSTATPARQSLGSAGIVSNIFFQLFMDPGCPSLYTDAPVDIASVHLRALLAYPSPAPENDMQDRDGSWW